MSDEISGECSVNNVCECVASGVESLSYHSVRNCFGHESIDEFVYCVVIIKNECLISCCRVADCKTCCSYISTSSSFSSYRNLYRTSSASSVMSLIEN